MLLTFLSRLFFPVPKCHFFFTRASFEWFRLVCDRVNPISLSHAFPLISRLAALQTPSSRSIGEVSKSYGLRWYAGKPSGKGGAKKSTTAATPVATSSNAVMSQQRGDPRVAVARLREVRVDPMTLLTEQQQELVAELSRRPATVGEDCLGPEAPEEPSAPGLKALGLPLDSRDVVKLLHQSLSGIAGHNVHFRPFFFSNIFQSAPAVAAYVAAALEADNSWQRIERFFISSIDEDKLIKGIKVRISGRLGRKADMASIKEWTYGDPSAEMIRSHVDYGAASALTRMGVTGVKVWLRYHESAIPENYFTRKTGFTMPLSKLLSQPLHSQGAIQKQASLNMTSAWWSIPGPMQPLQNRTWEAIEISKGLDPSMGGVGAGMPLYMGHKKRRKFGSIKERNLHLRRFGLKDAQYQNRVVRVRRSGQLILRSAALANSSPLGSKISSSSSSSSSGDEEGGSSSSSDEDKTVR